MYRTVQPLPNQTSESHRSALETVFGIYNRAGFSIKTIHCDNEFQPLVHPLTNEFGIGINYSNPQEHVPEAERNIRVVKERFRASFHRLPFTKLPRVMVQVLAMECAKKLNFFPPKGGISPFYSPRMILHQANLDFSKHCSIPFGTYVQAHQEPNPTNAQHPRTLDCIYLRYVDNLQGGHELLNLHTGHTIKRRSVTPVPITQNVIDLVHALATQQGMPDGIKITSKTGVILYDSSHLAGVDYDQDDPEDDPDDEDYQDSEDYSVTSEENAELYDPMDANELAEILSSPEFRDRERAIPLQEPASQAENSNNQTETEVILEDNSVQEDEDTTPQVTTRSGREVKAPERRTFMHQSHLQTQTLKPLQYTADQSKVIAKHMCEFNAMMLNPSHKHHSFMETFSLKKGLKKFGDKGRDAAFGEMKQLHDRAAFAPVDIATLSQQEKQRALESLIFLVEKRDGRVKARTCANGSPQRVYTPKEDTASPTVMTESILLTALIEAKENRDVMTVDIPNAFIQTDIEEGDRIIMKIRGPLVDMLVEMDPETYKTFVVFDNSGSKILYVQVLKAIYGMLQSSMLFYKKLCKDLQSIGFVLNPYDPCVANRVVQGQQHTVTWHVDDLKSSHKDPKINDLFHKWLESKYGNPEIGQVKATRGKRHDYLAMVLDYSIPGKLQVDMTNYVKDMVNEFPGVIKPTNCPWTDNLFKVDTNSPQLAKDKAEEFHTFVAKGLFVCKRARQDIQPAIAFLSTRVKGPTQNDWSKLIKMMGFLKTTQKDVLTLDADSTGTIIWYLDASFAVHHDFRSHTGAVMTMGNGCVQSVSTKQKINTRSSTEAELVSTDDIIAKVIWTKLFLEAQGVKVTENVIFRDNQSTMKLEQNGKASSGKRTRHFNIKYFYITCLIENKEVKIKYCPTDLMLADYMTKPLTGRKFAEFCL